MLKRFASITVAALVIALGSATSSQAANGVCGNQELCLYKNNNWSGGLYDFFATVSDDSYVGNSFFGGGPTVNNNASSSSNNDGAWSVTVHNGAFQTGAGLPHRPAGSGCLSGICPAYATLGIHHSDKFTSHGPY
ncbi:peptidase inhibitor family I36 protein [Streptomyces sp. NPDC056534]|uniref:peptidase inhibitor family I36 protein n=1 Tax=Streptomyces sp. NPDC056534 TaxID=3345857 RepID=UPI0036D106AF